MSDDLPVQLDDTVVLTVSVGCLRDAVEAELDALVDDQDLPVLLPYEVARIGAAVARRLLVQKAP